MIPLFKVGMAEDVEEWVTPVLKSGYIGEGEEVKKFEKELQKEINWEDQPVAVNSCTSAIHVVLLALGIVPGDEIITTPMTCVATNSPIRMLGARPVWADIDPETGNISSRSIQKLITIRTKAIIAVDWTGRPVNYKELKDFGFPVIQDAAHGPYIDRTNHGDFICLSFGPIKHLTSGDGGAIFFREKRYFSDYLKTLRWYGLNRESSQDFRCAQNIEIAGSKFHMNNINAAIGRANLPKLKWRVEQHQKNALFLHTNIVNSSIILPPHHTKSNYWVFPLITERRDEFIKYMESKKITASRVHARNDKHTAYNFHSGELWGTSEFDRTQVNIPCGWWLTQEDLLTITKAVNEWTG